MSSSKRKPNASKNSKEQDGIVEIYLDRAEQLLQEERGLLSDSRLREDMAQWIKLHCLRKPNQPARKLIIYLPQNELITAMNAQEEIERYFITKRADERLSRKEIVGQAWVSAFIGILFLVVVLFVAAMMERIPGHIAEIMTEGLTVLAWVGVWRLTEEIVYEWYPKTREIRRHDKLIKLDVSIMMSEP